MVSYIHVTRYAKWEFSNAATRSLPPEISVKRDASSFTPGIMQQQMQSINPLIMNPIRYTAISPFLGHNIAPSFRKTESCRFSLFSQSRGKKKWRRTLPFDTSVPPQVQVQIQNSGSMNTSVRRYHRRWQTSSVQARNGDRSVVELHRLVENQEIFRCWETNRLTREQVRP